MADFIHCNICFKLSEQDSSRKFFLSACGHLFCQRCAERAAANKTCGVCGKKSNVVEINDQLNVSARQMFMDPLDLANQLAKKAQRQIAETVQFQKSHRMNYLNFLQRQLKKAKKLHEFADEQVTRRQECEREIQRLNEEVTRLKQRMLQVSSPGVASNSINAYTGNEMQNDVMPRMTQRHKMINESGISLATMGHRRNERNNFVVNPLAASPYGQSTSGTPRLTFGLFGRDNAKVGLGESQNSMIHRGQRPCDQPWRSMVRGNNGGMPRRRELRQHDPENIEESIMAALTR